MTSPAELAAFYRRDQEIRETEERLAKLRAESRVHPPPFSGGAQQQYQQQPASTAALSLQSLHPSTEDIYLHGSPQVAPGSPPSYIAVPPSQLAPILTDSRGMPIGGGTSPNRSSGANNNNNATTAAAPPPPFAREDRAEQEAAVRAAVAASRGGGTGPISATPAHLAVKLPQPLQQPRFNPASSLNDSGLNATEGSFALGATLNPAQTAGLFAGATLSSQQQQQQQQPKKEATAAAPTGLTPLQERDLVGMSNLAIGDPAMARQALSSPAFRSNGNVSAAALAADLGFEASSNAGKDADRGGMMSAQPSLAIDPDSRLEVPDIPTVPFPADAVLQQLDRSTHPSPINSSAAPSGDFTAAAGGSPMPQRRGSVTGAAASPSYDAQKATAVPPTKTQITIPPIALGSLSGSPAANQQQQQQVRPQQQQQQHQPSVFAPAASATGSPMVHYPSSQQQQQTQQSQQTQQQQQMQKDRLFREMENAMGYGSQPPTPSNQSSRGGSQAVNYRFDDDHHPLPAHNQQSDAGAPAAASLGVSGGSHQQQQRPASAAATSGAGGFHYSMGPLNAGQSQQHQAQLLAGAQAKHTLSDVMNRVRRDSGAQQQAAASGSFPADLRGNSGDFQHEQQQQQSAASHLNPTAAATGRDGRSDAELENLKRMQHQQQQQQQQQQEQQLNSSENHNTSAPAAETAMQQQEDAAFNALAERYGHSSPGRMIRRLHESERQRLALVREVQALREDLKEAAEAINSKHGAATSSSSVARHARSAGAQSFDPNAMNENVVVRVRSTDAMEGNGAQWAAEIDEEDQARTRAQQVMTEMLRAIDARKATEVRLQQVSAENQRLRDQAKQAHERETALHKMLTQYQDAFNKWRSTWVDRDKDSGSNGDGGGSVLLGKSAGLSTVRVQILEARVEALTRENEKLRTEMDVAAARRKAEEDAEASRLALRGTNSAASMLNVTSTKGAAALRRRGADQETDVLVRMFELQRSNDALRHTVNEMKLQRR